MCWLVIVWVWECLVVKFYAIATKYWHGLLSLSASLLLFTILSGYPLSSKYGIITWHFLLLFKHHNISVSKLAGIQSNRVSAEIQDTKTATHKTAVNSQSSHSAQPHPLHYQSSLSQRKDSYRASENQKRNRMPHYSPDQKLIESFSITDSTIYSNRMKSTGSK